MRLLTERVGALQWTRGATELDNGRTPRGSRAQGAGAERQSRWVGLSSGPRSALRWLGQEPVIPVTRLAARNWRERRKLRLHILFNYFD